MDPLDPQAWRRIAPILDVVLDAPREKRQAILDESCGHDPELRNAVERLVRVGETETGSLDRPAAIDEARAASRLDHPNIQTVYDAGETESGRVYVALALYDGPTLADRLAAHEPLPLAEVRSIAAQLADGLGAAHAAGIVHRDVKPSNVIVRPDAPLKILDFGVARIVDREQSRPGAAYGTIAYMSPEQTRGETVGVEADVWALGVVLYEMLAGRRPFRGRHERNVIRAIRHETPTLLQELRPDTPQSLSRVVERCLRKHPDQRYPDMASVRADLPVPGTDPAATRSAPALHKRGRTAATIALVVGAAGGGWVLLGAPGFGGADDGAHVLPAATAMTVLPFVPVTDDSAGRRLGRQLAVAVSSNLHGVGPIRTPEGLIVLSALHETGPPVDEPAAARLARRLATGSYLRGTLIRGDQRIRVDAALRDAGTGEEIGRVTTSAAVDDIGGLTDSVTLAVLRAVWRRGDVPSPSMGALTTGSLPALRAYLEGEVALAEGRYGPAVTAFDSAFEADSTFWYALWRSTYPREFEPTGRLGPDQYERLYAHRHVLPEADRLLLESGHLDSQSDQLSARREITHRFPAYWPGWWAYANTLVHSGPLLGVPTREARAALERTLELHPGFVAAWEHLFWITMRQRDTARISEALVRLERATNGENPRLQRDMLPTYRAVHSVVMNGGLAAEQVERKLAHASTYGGPLPPSYFGIDLLLWGACGAQREVSRAVLARNPPPETADAHRFALGLAMACTGDWAAGVSQAALRPNTFVDRFAPMAPYGLAVTGAWLGELPAERASALRPDVARSPAHEAERRWLDGLLAFAERRPAALEAARAALAAHRAEHAPRLERSLAAFQLALAGDSAAAGRRLAALEFEGIETGAFHRYAAAHPWLTGVHRLAAARWLAAAGYTATAFRLLGWEEAILQPRHFLTDPAGEVLAPRSALMRARLHAARGDSARAAFHYGTVVQRYDRPAAPVRAALAEASDFPGAVR